METNQPKVVYRRCLIGCGSMIEVPKRLGVCPYCGGVLQVTFTGWEQQADGKWLADELQVDCQTEPAMESPEWDDWMKQHSEMPYVYQLPVDEKIKTWINRHFFFEIEDEAKHE